MRLAYMVATPEVRAFPFAWMGPSEQVLPAIAAMGYEGVEIQVCDPDAFDRRAYWQALSAHELEAVTLSTGPVGRQDGLYLIHGDVDIRHRALERYSRVIDLASEWGCPAAIGRGRGLLSSASSPAVGREWWRAALETLLAHAERRGVTILIEPQNRYNADLLVTMDEALNLIADVGSERLRIEADTYHQALEERAPL